MEIFVSESCTWTFGRCGTVELLHAEGLQKKLRTRAQRRIRATQRTTSSVLHPRQPGGQYFLENTKFTSICSLTTTRSTLWTCSVRTEKNSSSSRLSTVAPPAWTRVPRTATKRSSIYVTKVKRPRRQKVLGTYLPKSRKLDNSPGKQIREALLPWLLQKCTVLDPQTQEMNQDISINVRSSSGTLTRLHVHVGNKESIVPAGITAHQGRVSRSMKKEPTLRWKEGREMRHANIN